VTPAELRSSVLDDVLAGVETPGQYIGGEVNAAVKADADCRVALCFPDTYSVGMSHVGLKILYEILNAREGVAAERCFVPWPDMERELRARDLPLYGLESFTPLADFDAIGFSLQYELAASNVLTVLDLAGLPVRSAERGEDAPLVIAGGPCAYNPEPLADFVDLFLIGEAEESLPELVAKIRAARGRASRRELLLECARSLPGAYAPSLYEVSYESDGRVAAVTPAADGVPELVERRIVADLDAAPAPVRPVVPFVETVHDRLAVEIMRGCAHGCRFCQAGGTYRPLRTRSVEKILEAVEKGLAATGYDEVGLLSLSSSDYPHLPELVRKLHARHGKAGVSVSLPSLRVNEELARVPELVSAVRKGAITVAPEAGTERLRRVINKCITDEQLFAGLAAAFEAGWNRVKLYFISGLPTETDEDLAAAAGIIGRAAAAARKNARRGGKINASVSNFVPKPGTPFQWEPMCSAEDFARRHRVLRSALRSRRGVKLKFHDVGPSMLEGVMARGDRRLGAVIERAWRAGARLDAWSEHFREDLWQEALAAEKLDPDFYTSRPRGLDEVLPWDHISQGTSRDFLAAERGRALAGEETPDCPAEPGAENCTGCGACPRGD
jgi:radical SAM family uncharacterized protein